MTDAGVRTAADTEVIVADCTASTTDEYYETTKKWIGQITFTLSSTGGSTFSFDFNYGLTKYEDFGNNDFIVSGFESVGKSNTSDTGFNIELLHHDNVGWTYHATAFVPGGSSVICNMNTDYNTETDLSANQQFSYKRTGMRS